MGATRFKTDLAGGKRVSQTTAQILGIGSVPFWEKRRREEIEARAAKESANRTEELRAIAQATGSVSVPIWPTGPKGTTYSNE